jgi:starch synthase (maltosyl-transferring)
LDTIRNLRGLHRSLSRPSTTGAGPRYEIPALWQSPAGAKGPLDVDPFAFYAGVIGGIIDRPAVAHSPGVGSAKGGWSAKAVVYNMLVRLTCAYDHDGDGSLARPVNRAGWRETGSFLKAIALLPYIRSLGANTLHLLPVQEIGMDGRRGSLGSPYAVKDPMAFDPGLGEPNTGLPLEAQFSALIEAAHHLGFRVILELPLRTLSKDAVWAKDHPDWFYWIDEGKTFRPPVFDAEQLRQINRKISAGDHTSLPPPPVSYTDMFTLPPAAGSVGLVGRRWVGRSPEGKTVVIPGAFADWPPDDSQPVWEDITYLKFHQDDRFNYPAYNTVRMYDSSLLEGGTETEKLWGRLEDLIVSYAGTYHIDGIMIDMAHALPQALTERIISASRRINPDFAFWAEDFSRTPDQVRIGFNAVLGGQWACQHNRRDFRDMLEWIAGTPELLPHLATPETHNTPRAVTRPGGERYSRYSWTISCFVPGIPYIHSGIELFETRPVNTGLGFTPEEVQSFPPDALPLFSAHSLDWGRTRVNPGWIRKPLEVREQYLDCIIPGEGGVFQIVDAGGGILTFRCSGQGGNRTLIVVANTEMEQSLGFLLNIGPPAPDPKDLLTGEAFSSSSGAISGRLDPGRVVVFTLSGD